MTAETGSSPKRAIAILVDLDNIWFGLRATGSRNATPTNLVQAIQHYANSQGSVSVAKVYASLPLASPQLQFSFMEAGYEVVIGARSGNSPDIHLALDGQHLIFTRPEIDTFLLASGDSDFEALASAIRAAKKTLIVMAPRAVASRVLRKRADIFIALEECLAWDSSAVSDKQPIVPHRQAKRQRNTAPVTQKSPPALRVFLCHSKHDKPQVRDLYFRLKGEIAMQPWLDEQNLLPGQDWEIEITRAVREAHCVIVCLSKRAIDNAGYVHKEIRFALDAADRQPEGTIFLIPLRLDACEVPERLARYQWVDLFEPGGYELLLRALRARGDALK